jgi:hypothetical protein
MKAQPFFHHEVSSRPAGRLVRARCAGRSVAGIALAEVLTGIAVITIVSATALWALGASNRLATVNRNFTGAKTLLQNRIDEALSTSYTNASVPAILSAGTTTSIVTVNPGLQAITGTMSTVVTVVDPTLNVRQVKATVNYPFRGRTYSLSMVTARVPD